MIHCFYHNDLDGHCAGAIVKQKYPETVLREIRYGYDSSEIHDVVDGGDTVYIVDFALDVEDLQHLLTYVKEVHWIDHHKVSIERFETAFNLADEALHKNLDKLFGVRDISKAGCELTWEYLHEDSPMPEVVRYVGRWDVWDHSDPKTIPMNRGLQLTGATDPANPLAMRLWEELFKNDRTGPNKDWNAFDQVMNLGVIGEAMKAQYDEFIGRAAYRIADWEGYRTVALNARCYDSYVMFEHDEKFEDFDPEVLVWFNQTANGDWKYSIRAYPGKDTDVSEIAKRYGGGGHRGAAGFTHTDLLCQPDRKED